MPFGRCEGSADGTPAARRLLDKTGTITLGNRMASDFILAPGVTAERLADAAQLASLADETPEGRSIAVLAKEKFGLRGRDVAEPHAKFISFTGAEPIHWSGTPASTGDIAEDSPCSRRDESGAPVRLMPRIGGGRQSAATKVKQGSAALFLRHFDDVAVAQPQIVL